MTLKVHMMASVMLNILCAYKTVRFLGGSEYEHCAIILAWETTNNTWMHQQLSQTARGCTLHLVRGELRYVHASAHHECMRKKQGWPSM